MKTFRSVKTLPENATYDEMASPVGQLTIIASSEYLHAVFWENDRENPDCKKIIKNLPQCTTGKIIEATKNQLSEYFQGERKVFHLPLALNGTEFQIKVWQQLIKIPYAKTLTYGEQAEKVGNKNKARAVGAANGVNPISIIVPCHRVIGCNGRLVGFGGGLDKKAYLLALEKKSKR